MKESNEMTTSRIRKEYGKRGERTQKMMAFRVDVENLEWLESQPNKGRYINQLISNDRQSHGK